MSIRQYGVTLNAATSNVALSVPLPRDESTVGFGISGLTAAAAVLTPECSADSQQTWSAIQVVVPGTGAAQSTITADGTYRVNTAGLTHVRLRVSTTGTGTITIGYNASNGNG